MENDINNTETEKNNKRWDHEQFKEALINASNGVEIKKDEMPDEIDLSEGVIGERIDYLADNTKKNELLIYGKVDEKDRLLVFTADPIEGNQVSAPLKYKIKKELSKDRKSLIPKERVAFTAHTHPIALPPSPTDMGLLLERTTGDVSIIVAGRVRYMLVATDQTDSSLDRTEIENWIKQEDAYLDYLESKAMEGINNRNVASYEEYQTYEFMHSQTIQSRRFYQSCRDKGIEVYVSHGDNVYTRQNAEKDEQRYLVNR